MRNKLLSSRLKELREANGYTQEDIAAALGVVRQTYSHYETGSRSPSAETLYKLAGIYNVAVSDLMHLTMDVDRNEFFDAPNPTSDSDALASYLEYCNKPANKKRLQNFSSLEKEMIYYFDMISEEDKKEIIEFTKIKAKKTRQ